MAVTERESTSEFKKAVQGGLAFHQISLESWSCHAALSPQLSAFLTYCCDSSAALLLQSPVFNATLRQGLTYITPGAANAPAEYFSTAMLSELVS